MQNWLDAYGESHQDPTNKAIHWICVPTIYFCVVGFLWSIPVPFIDNVLGPNSLALLTVVLVGLFYLLKSRAIMVGMVLWSGLCLWLCELIEAHLPWPLWSICLVLFIAAWVGQFYGHKVEGKKPSFLEDVQFLMIGPAWLLSFIYKRLGIPY
ncbi:MAG: Mpo1-like protein [Flavobacteriales bacterium]